ncbi:hypothetical protein QJS04_geneDACA017374 [Acorus gramineus]|uniref:Uncharacterized protein n=1 Tax=Acorus gramineus TaxID=55184 RepID=A0AAV9A1X7_ACOGR|nr:hypothetical protein QJS04_geneDACA017374 [Acorus gramineus]
MNDLSAAARDRRRRHLRCGDGAVPRAVPCVVVPLLLAGIAVSAFFSAVVHNWLLLLFFLLLSSLPLSFLLWNSLASSSDRSVSLFLDRFPNSDLRSARHGQFVKVAGVVSCGSVSLESSYEKVRRCVYTSTALYCCKGFEFWASIARHGWFGWRLAYLERLTADFYITDAKSGMRILVKAGNDSKVIPLISENPLVHTRRKNTVLSSTLRKWLGERNLSAEDNLLHIEEGYVQEGSPLTVLGILNKSDDILMITPPTECICTGCQWKKCLLPTDFHGLVLRFSNSTASLASCSPPLYPDINR